MAQPVRIADGAENLVNIQSEGPALLAYTTRYDYDVSGNLIYQAWALSVQPGSGIAPVSSAAIWAIRRFTYNVSNQLTATEWASGTSAQANIWDNRASLSYQ